MRNWIVSGIIAILADFAYAQDGLQKDFYTHGPSFVRYIHADRKGAGCGVRLSNGTDEGAITFVTLTSVIIPFPVDIAFGHELGTGTTHGARKGDPFEVRVDGKLLATGSINAGVAPYEGSVDEWPGALLDALAYGKILTWGFPGKKPLISVAVPDNKAMARALVECQAYGR